MDSVSLTTIVVTKGRAEYLRELLESLESQLDEHHPVLIIDNASSDHTPAVIQQWLARQRTPVHTVRVEVNVADAQQWISIARERFGSDWVTFPGDDDRLLPGHLADLSVAIAATPELTCVAAGIQDMDPSGRLLSESTIPRADGLRSRGALVGRLLSRPEFSWPAVAFKSSVIDGPMPQFRFTFDWWVQLNCSLAGPTAATGRASVAYRRHPAQESQMWSTRRKYAEASWMLHGVISGPRFEQFVAAISPVERDALVNSLTQAGGPVYADPIFGLPPAMAAVQVLQRAGTDAHALIQVMRQSASALGLSPSDQVLTTWLGLPVDPHAIPVSRLQIDIDAARDLCLRAQAIARLAGVRPIGSAHPAVQCEHADSAGRIITIGCRQGGTDAELAGILRDQVEARGEDAASISSGLQPMERKVLHAYRSATRILPHRMRTMVKRKVK